MAVRIGPHMEKFSPPRPALQQPMVRPAPARAADLRTAGRGGPARPAPISNADYYKYFENK